MIIPDTRGQEQQVEAPVLPITKPQEQEIKSEENQHVDAETIEAASSPLKENAYKVEAPVLPTGNSLNDLRQAEQSNEKFSALQMQAFLAHRGR